MKKSVVARWVAAPAIVASLALTGCAHSPATAAEMGGTTITERDLDHATDTLTSVEGVSDQQVDRGAVLTIMLRGEAARKIAADKHLQLNPDERPAALGGQYPPEVLANADAKRLYDGFADFQIVAQQLGGEELGASLDGLHTTINPRYGIWQDRTARVVGQNGSLSTPDLAAR